jgi:excisionase family DNA binding protein
MTLDTAIRELVRELVRDELRPIRDELRAISNALQVGRSSSDARRADFLTVEQVAATMKVTQSTVRTWIKSGALRASRPTNTDKLGRIFRVSRSDLDTFVDGATKPGPKREIDIKAEAARIVASLSRNRGR